MRRSQSGFGHHFHHHNHGRDVESGSKVLPTLTKKNTKTLSSSHKEIFRVAKKLPVVKKLNEGKFDDLTWEESERLFHVLDVSKKGSLDFGLFSEFITELLNAPWTEDELQAVFDHSDENADKKIEVDEFHTTLTTGAVKQMLVSLHKDMAVHSNALREKKLGTYMTRSLLLDKLAWRVHRDDSFKTLPFTTGYFFVFMFLVIAHLKIEARQELEAGIESYMEKFGGELVGPFVRENVADHNTFWTWMNESAVHALFGTPSTESAYLLQVSTSNVLIADVRLRQFLPDGSSRDEWLLHSPPAVAYLHNKRQAIAEFGSQPFSLGGDFVEAARASIQHLVTSRWLSEDATIVKVIFCTYIEKMKMFATTEVQINFPPSGYVRPRVASAAMPFVSYSNPIVYIVDAVFLAYVGWQFMSETRDVVKDVRVIGFSGLLINFDFWNTVDWLTITLGVLQFAIWGTCVRAMNDELIMDLVDSHTLKLHSNLMDIDETWLLKVYDQLDYVAHMFIALHLLMGVNVVVIMAKFFKGFGANARLQVVTSTLVEASVDLMHWMIVFLTFFLAFTMFGHIAFGQDLSQFRSINQSLSTCFSVLMGEFEWYVDMVDDTWPTMQSGMPKFLIQVWFVLFMLLCFLVMFNMLLAIIMDRYEEVADEVQKQGDLAPPVWTQASRFIRRWKETRGFMGLRALSLQLDDDTTSTHADEFVTKDSLLDAFKGMKAEQADWLITWLRKEASILLNRQEEIENAAHQERVETALANLTEELHLVSLGVNSSAAALRTMTSDSEQQLSLQKHDSTHEQPKRDSNGSANSDPIGQILKMLEEGKQNQRNTEACLRELTRTVNDLVQEVAELKSDRKSDVSNPKLPHPKNFTPPHRWCSVEASA